MRNINPQKYPSLTEILAQASLTDKERSFLERLAKAQEAKQIVPTPLDMYGELSRKGMVEYLGGRLIPTQKGREALQVPVAAEPATSAFKFCKRCATMTNHQGGVCKQCGK